VEPYHVLVLGGGPGGYVAAIRAAQLGMRVALVEREALGGICLNWGCIPSKALLRNAEVLNLFHHAETFGIAVQGLQADYSKAVERSRGVVDRMVKGVAFLLRKNGVDVFPTTGYVRAPDRVELADGRQLQTRHLIVATGARPRALPGIALDGERVITSREALALSEVPRRAVLIGAGPIGMEFSYVWRSYGAEVTLLEAMPHILPQEDEEIAAVAARAFEKLGVQMRTRATVMGVRRDGDGVVVEFEGPDGRETLTADVALVGIGVRGNSDGIGLEELGVEIEGTFIRVDERMATNVPGVYAIGDVTGPPMLAHVASAQGVNCVEIIAGKNPPPLDYEQMPRATYCQPEVASIGLTERQARERELDYVVGTFPFRGNGRALALAEPDGLAKVIADRHTGDILGIHLVGASVTELLGEASLARTLEATPAAIGYAVHAHPTLSEVVKEAALSALGEAIHVWQEKAVPARG
jgi:dihydrolipoamide dehydrogenase